MRMAGAVSATSVPIGDPFRVPVDNLDQLVDMERVRRNVQQALGSIDWSRRDIVINVPGTGDRKVLDTMMAAYDLVYPPGSDASLVYMPYMASFNIPTSVAEGVATLKLLLAAIAAHGGNHRVLAWGQSQGALVLGEVMADPASKIVERATLFGHPWAARSHFEDGHDPRVLEINYLDDHIAMPITGNLQNAINGFTELWGGNKLKGLSGIADILRANPDFAFRVFLWVARGKIFPKSAQIDPHDYVPEYERGIRFLQTGEIEIPPYPAVASIARHYWNERNGHAPDTSTSDTYVPARRRRAVAWGRS